MADVRSFDSDDENAFDKMIEAAERTGDYATVGAMLIEAGRLAKERLIRIDLDDKEAPIQAPKRTDVLFQKLAIKPPETKCHMKSCETITASGICDACADKAARAAAAAAISERIKREIPDRFKWARWYDADVPRVFQGWEAKAAEIRRRIHGDRGVIIGAAGSGKTSLACAWLRARIENGEERARFVAAHDLMSPSYVEGVAVLELAITASSLVLDDLGEELAGAGAATGMASQRIDAVVRLVRIRHDRGLSMLVTTGRTLETVASVYGDGVARRIFEGAPMVKL